MILTFPRSINKKRIRILFRINEFYGHCLLKYAEIIEPFAKLYKKHVDYIWTNIQQFEFNYF